MDGLPLMHELPKDNLYKLLNLPLSAKWPQVKKNFETRENQLKDQLAKAIGAEKTKLEAELSVLQQAFEHATKRISDGNTAMHHTTEALKGMGLPPNSDWDTVNDRYQEMQKTVSEASIRPHYDQLQRSKELLQRHPKTGKTWIGAAIGLGVAGISLAAYHALGGSSATEITHTVAQPSAGAAAPASERPEIIADHEQVADGITATTEDEALQEYIDSHQTVEDEMYSLLGLAPDPTLQLTLQHKLQVLNSLITSV